MFKKNKVTLTPLIIIAGLIGLSACNAGTPPEITEMRRLCALDAGQKVYETVQADGYFDANEDGQPILGSLFQGDGQYQYVEFCKEKYANQAAVKLDTGCWRMEKATRDSGRCNIDADNEMKKWMAPPYPEFIKNQCLAIERIEKPKSRYHYEWENKRWVDGKSNVNYSRSESKIMDVEKGKLVAKEVIYGAFKNPDRSYGCGSPEVTGLSQSAAEKENIIVRTIKPIKK